MDKEIVFEFGGEGGGIKISRIHEKSGDKFLFQHNEFDPIREEEDLVVSITNEYDSFDQPFDLINSNYKWFMLCLVKVHEDYTRYIAEKLVEKLNKESITPKYLDCNKEDLEFNLKIKLNYSIEKGNSANWSYESL